MTTFDDFDSEGDVEKDAANVDSSCDKPENSKSIKCDKTAGCLMIKDKRELQLFYVLGIFVREQYFQLWLREEVGSRK